MRGPPVRMPAAGDPLQLVHQLPARQSRRHAPATRAGAESARRRGSGGVCRHRQSASPRPCFTQAGSADDSTACGSATATGIVPASQKWKSISTGRSLERGCSTLIRQLEADPQCLEVRECLRARRGGSKCHRAGAAASGHGASLPLPYVEPSARMNQRRTVIPSACWKRRRSSSIRPTQPGIAVSAAPRRRREPEVPAVVDPRIVQPNSHKRSLQASGCRLQASGCRLQASGLPEATFSL